LFGAHLLLIPTTFSSGCNSRNNSSPFADLFLPDFTPDINSHPTPEQETEYIYSLEYLINSILREQQNSLPAAEHIQLLTNRKTGPNLSFTQFAKNGTQPANYFSQQFSPANNFQKVLT
jgi:hypothetical protein